MNRTPQVRGKEVQTPTRYNGQEGAIKILRHEEIYTSSQETGLSTLRPVTAIAEPLQERQEEVSR